MFGIRKLESRGYRMTMFAYDYVPFSDFDRTPTCDGQTDRHMNVALYRAT